MSGGSPSPSAGRARAWAELLRLPNLSTVPGDPLAGFAIATLGRDVPAGPALLCALAACAFYLAGLVLNDLMDLEEDRRDRPHRPLPSGRVPVGAAQAATLALFALGFLLLLPVGRKPLVAGAAVALLVLLYNSPLRRVRALGPVLMGSCRASSFFLGVVAGYAKGVTPVRPMLIAFETVLVYIAAITLLARHETTGRNPHFSAGLPTAALLIGLGLLGWHLPPRGAAANAGFALAALAAAGLAFDATRCMHLRRRVDPPVIGQLISVLIFWQSAQLFLAARPAWGLALLLAWPLSRRLARRFYQS